MKTLLHFAQDMARNLSFLRHPGGHQNVTEDPLEGQRALKSLVMSLHPPKMRLKVLQVRPESRSTVTLRLERQDGPLPPFRAGQYVNLFVSLEGVKTSRPYSISSPPGMPWLEVTVRTRIHGFVSSYLCEQLSVGDEIQAAGPFGHFGLEPAIDPGEYVFLAGGSGITPFMSILREQEALGWPKRIHLLYGCRNLDDVPFELELNALSRGNPQLNYALVLSEASPGFRGVRGFINEHLISHHVGDLSDKTFLLCGPPAMLSFCQEELQSLRIPPQRIRRELFGLPPDPTREPGWPEDVGRDDLFSVEVVGKQTVQARGGETLMVAFERAGLQPPSRCRSGECGFCRMKLVSGSVFVPSSATIREADRKYGLIHPCMTYPVGPLVVSF